MALILASTFEHRTPTIQQTDTDRHRQTDITAIHAKQGGREAVEFRIFSVINYLQLNTPAHPIKQHRRKEEEEEEEEKT